MNRNELLDHDEVSFYITNHFDSSEYIREIFLSIIKNKWEEYLYHFFTIIYDKLYHDIITKKLSLSLETRKLLELLSIPIYKKTWEEKEKLYKKVSIDVYDEIKYIFIKK